MLLSDAAQKGFEAAVDYDQFRPTYPPEAVKQLLSVLEIRGQSGAKVADLAAGTGIFTQILATQPEGYEIIAVEPHEGMRAQLEQRRLHGVTAVAGTAEQIPIEDASLSSLVAAQAFHWFANMDALQEIHRVLKPAGTFGMIWNIEDYNAPKDWKIHEGWESTCRDIIWSFDDGLPRFRHQKWKKVFDEQVDSNPLTIHQADPLFGLPVAEQMFDFTTWLSKETIWSRFRTLSQIAILEGEELEEVKRTFWDAVDAPDTETDSEGRIPVHGKTVLAWASKIPTQPF